MDDFIKYKLYKYDMNWKVVDRVFQEQNKLNARLTRQNRRNKILILVMFYYLMKHDKQLYYLKTKVSSLQKDISELENDIGE